VRASAATASGAPAFSEEHLALEFAARHHDEFRYVAKGIGWMRWEETRWREDDKLAAFDRARALGREFARRAGKRRAHAIASAKTRAAVVSLVQSDERIAATADQWDSDPWLLNTPGGTIDLKTGRLRPHERADYITKITAVAPDPNCPAPLWMAFLERVTAGDKDLQAYLQRVAGYMLTGLTIEHALFFLYGTGANGKSVFIKTITSVAADYHRPVPMEALMWSRNERHPTDIAGLRGARIGSAIETGRGRNWDEPKIMLLTGGDKISARLMRQDFFDFTPQFKLIIAGNHKPGLRSVNEAIRRRLHLVPFTVTIPKEERDPQLGEKLKSEWPGVLAWMIEGCLEWQRLGLAPPKIVTEATDEYLEAQDMLAQWLNDHCEVDKKARESSSRLYGSWQVWCELQGEKPGHQRAFNDELEQKGFKRSKEERGYVFRGWLSVELDRLQGERLCDRPVSLHTVLHMTQELRTLLAELGLNDETRSGQQPVLRDYLHSKNGAAP
jgi:putative DNA primase/helicase